MTNTSHTQKAQVIRGAKMTLNDLIKKLNEFISKNPESGDLPIYFDSEAQKFNHHLVSLDFVYCEDDRIVFHEDHPHRGFEDRIYNLGIAAYKLMEHLPDTTPSGQGHEGKED